MSFLGKSLKRKVSDKDPTTKNTGSKSINASGTGYFYQTGIVKEFIGEPDVYLNARRGNLPPVVNPSDYGIMTKNCLIAYIIDNSESLKGKPPVICYPFFPHLSLPIKTGEHVWLLKEEFLGRDVYYWISRKTGVKQTDDVNYTHAERFILIDSKLNPEQRNKKEKRDLLEDTAPNELSDSAYTSFDNSSQDNLPDGLNNSTLVSDSFSFKQGFTLEPVPPVRRKCGDALLLGSNNTLVHLTTEKFKTNALNRKDLTGLSTEPNLPGRYPLSPAIDLCVGRKKEELSQLKNSTGDTAKSGAVEIVKGIRDSLHSEFESYEIDKLGNLLDKNRPFSPSLSTDADATNCGARLYLSNNCAIDETFGSSFNVLDTLGGSSLATYADHNRVIADNSLRLTNRIGQSFLNMDAKGNVVIKSSINNGQQFLSLNINGTSRLQAKQGGKIELAVSNDNDNEINTVNEPYVLYSELRPLLEDMCADIAGTNALLFQLGTIIDVIATVVTPLGIPIKPALAAADTAIALAGATKLFAKDAKITPATFPLLMAPAELGGRLGSGNSVTESGTIASKKIFGESN